MKPAHVHCSGRCRIATLLVAATLLLSRAAAAGSSSPVPGDDGRCLTCHGMANLTVRETGTADAHDFSVQPAAFSASVHGHLACQQCHEGVGAFPHRFPAGRAKVTCAQDCHARDGAGRPYTHQKEADDFDVSAHRPRATGAAGDRPACLTCHGSGNPHAIRRAKKTTPRERMALCVTCHDDRARMARSNVELEAVPSYKRSFHYKAITFGAGNAAVCQDCHSTHRILPASDPRSSIAPAALPATCGQTACHLGARKNFAVSGANHLDLRVRREPILLVEEWLFWLLTSGTMAMLAIGIALDVQKKFGWWKLAGDGARHLLGLSSTVFDGGRRAIRLARWLFVE